MLAASAAVPQNFRTNYATRPLRDIDVRIRRPNWTKKPETARRVRGRINAFLDAGMVVGHRIGATPAQYVDHLPTCAVTLEKSGRTSSIIQRQRRLREVEVHANGRRATFAIAVPGTIIRARTEHDHLHPAFRIVGRRFAPIDPVAAVGFFPSLSSHPDRSVRIASAKVHPIQETNRQGTPATHEPATSAARLRAAPPCAF
ncbi:hypothetical protein K6W21_18685 [Burkholderia latens]|uniref:hypothetical protein n=1 Tax=Burkholderia latens TaxID=488446 RepID=UPI001C963D3E|nr:hypothetical protein [Burkholderia latens]MBY4696098.1 hypothetical protein [Burkholderia latens]